MPFNHCGPGIAPGLIVSPFHLEYPIHIQQHQGDRCINTVDTRDIDAYFRDTALRPFFEPGDILIFGNKTFHGTHTTKQDSKTRMSFDWRYHIGESLFGGIQRK